MITAADKLRCAERELANRQRAYPGRVQRRRMTAAKAVHELACMRAIVEDYRAAAEWERSISPPLPMFFKDAPLP